MPAGVRLVPRERGDSRRCWRKTRTCEIRKSRFGSWPHTCTSVRGSTSRARRITRIYVTLDEGCDLPITYTIDVPLALIVTQCFGQVTLGEVQAPFQELARVWPPVDPLDVLLDLTDQTSLPTLRDLEEVATEVRDQIGSRRFGRCAVVTDQDQLQESMHMFEVLVGRLFDAIEVFETPAKSSRG